VFTDRTEIEVTLNNIYLYIYRYRCVNVYLVLSRDKEITVIKSDNTIQVNSETILFENEARGNEII